ncbi:RidA family protein [Pararhodobacter oceanensis]|uniref:RidA family protein n=1 Tax=Pararhodobacter oceanensis TaxID=2172121 RepID=UPI003A8EC956
MSQSLPRPVPQGLYLPAIRHADTIYTSGFTPRRDGVLLHEGRVRADQPVESYREPVEISVQNAIWAVQAQLREGEHVALVLQLNVFVNADAGFSAHSRLADYASEALRAAFGEAGIGSRTALGVATLPSNAPIEINLVAAVAAGEIQR